RQSDPDTQSDAPASSPRPSPSSPSLDQCGQLDQIIHSQAGAPCTDRDNGVGTNQACPARRHHLCLTADVQIGSVVPPELLAIEELEILSRPRVEGMRDSHTPMRILRDGTS